ncbi:EscU/YscU/HrcU family type III secretion system export apparatus switch protein [Acidisoma silvae]|uniref:Flagellar type III secretion system protein FlhB n=1 Tax=Acidisoma silvae TaxID=2802396 RepID=A0A963YRB9_9PROT|nr:EscU/YscU/HrcU family type III secretion system export apparatus switch protein [Acidisoma silvae]MCB8874895.1 flagellar type III secretion system protein FlhB [Acidisoma silvae]
MSDHAPDAEKKHAPTERRLRQAVERGDMVRSTDLPKATATILTVLIALHASALVGGIILQVARTALMTAGTAPSAAAAAGAEMTLVMQSVLPVLVLVALLSLLASFLFGGWGFSLSSLSPDLGKLFSLSGLGEIFSVSHLTETVKSFVKFVVIGVVGGLSLLQERDSLLSLGHVRPFSAAPAFALILGILSRICLAIALIAATDMGLQLWLYRRRHRMSDAEMREEMKDAVGNPQVRQRQRAAQRRIARARQMRRLPEASVIVTNPTHVAVALRFRKGQDAAPFLVAKGVDLMAAEIVGKARGYGIPIVEAPPLARAVYRHVEPEEPIPVALYRACAEVLAYIWRLEAWRAAGIAAQKPMPPKIPDIRMPQDQGEA